MNSRRRFINKTIAAAATSLLLPKSLLSSDRIKENQKQKKN